MHSFELTAEHNISHRAQSLLKHLVELYIKHGEPVGSKTLAQRTYPELSPATIRKVMGDLEDQGLVHSPHTSSGRIPTARGLRFFVDSLLTVHPLDDKKISHVRSLLDPNQSTENLIASASSLLSEVTQMVGVVTMPKHDKLVLKHLEFLPLADNRILVILVINEREVQNRIITTQRHYTASELSQASNFLLQHFSGKDLTEARHELLHAMKKDRLTADRLMQTILDISEKAFESTPHREEYVMAGEFNLLSHSEIHEVDHLQKLFQLFNEKRQILHLLDACLQTDGVQLFIGEESGYEAFKTYSVVTSRYKVDGNVVGVLGVIGPTRMRYDQVIPIVDITAKLLGTALNPLTVTP